MHTQRSEHPHNINTLMPFGFNETLQLLASAGIVDRNYS